MNACNKENRRLPSPAEACGFVTYCLSIHVGIVYIVLAIFPAGTATATSELLSSFYHGPLLVSIPTILLVTFVAVPLVYAFLNHLSSPELTSMDNLYDEYSLHHPWPLNKNVFKDDGNEHLKREKVLDFCDFDVSHVNALMSTKVS